jgi:cell division septation protein DedD
MYMEIDMKSSILLPLLLVFCIAAVGAGCSSSEETAGAKPAGAFTRTEADSVSLPRTPQPTAHEDMPAPERTLPPSDQKPPATREAPQEKPADTKPAAPPPAVQQPAATPAQKTGIPMWSVQLGAFKSEQGANQLITEAKSKLNAPLYKDYDPASGFYKVTVGSFPTREQAAQYKTEVQAKGYTDSFVVEVRR